MKRFISFWSLSVLFCCAVSAQQGVRKIIPFDDNWKFCLGDAANAQQAVFNDAAWRTLTIPHDWSIEGANLESEPGGGGAGYFPSGIGWYRKTFNVSSLKKDSK